jgi:hypothetical protein
MSDTTALQETLKLVVDTVKDTVAAVNAGKASWGTALLYQNLVGDLFELLPDIGEIKSQVQGLQFSDIQVLLAAIQADLGPFAPSAQVIIGLVINVLKDLGPNFVTDLQTLVGKALEMWRAAHTPPATKANMTMPLDILPAGVRYLKDLPLGEPTTGFVIETKGMYLGSTRGWGYRWYFKPDQGTLFFDKKEDAEALAQSICRIKESGYQVKEYRYTSGTDALSAVS